jgi:hypothetical protein
LLIKTSEGTSAPRFHRPREKKSLSCFGKDTAALAKREFHRDGDAASEYFCRRAGSIPKHVESRYEIQRNNSSLLRSHPMRRAHIAALVGADFRGKSNRFVVTEECRDQGENIFGWQIWRREVTHLVR